VFAKLINTKILALLLLIFSFASLFIGVSDINLLNLTEKESIEIFLTSRIPRLIAVLITGASMAIAGLLMQNLCQNKFVSPQTGATIASAQFGFVFAVIFISQTNRLIHGLSAFIFATLGTIIFVFMINRIKFKEIVLVPLLGMILGGIISGLTDFLSFSNDVVQNTNDWLQGDFSLILAGNYEALYLCLPLLIVAFLYANFFNIAGLGENFAKSLGLNYQFILYLGLIIAAFLTASVVVTVGSVPFVGLIVPNLISLIKGDKIRSILVDNALLGALFVLVCDIFGRLIRYPYEIPIGLTLGVIGSAAFIVIMAKGLKK